MLDTNSTNVCPKCGGVMEKGAIYDEGYLSYRKQRWVKPTGKNFWSWSVSRKVDTFACTQCGYLESYLEPKK